MPLISEFKNFIALEGPDPYPKCPGLIHSPPAHNKSTDLGITDLTCLGINFLWNLAALTPESWSWSWSFFALCLQKMRHSF